MAHDSRIASGSVLIVDDERSILDILSQFLGDRGYRVTIASGAEEALRLVAAERFDVALIDLKLPDRAGIELIDPFRRADPEMRCVIMTAFASLESTIEAVRIGVFDYVLKPFDLIRIGEIVDAAAESAALGRESARVRARLEEANRKLEADAADLDRELLRINGELSRVNESLNRHVTRLRVLYQMGRDISSNENWSDALDRFLMALRNYLEADGTGLLLFSNNEESLKTRASYQIESAFLDEAIRLLTAAQRADALPSEMFSLEGCLEGSITTCLAMTARWASTVTPLIYKGRWLGFLIVRKEYASRKAYLRDYHFLNTIQTILTEEVANAANISRLRNLKDFNETVLERMNSGVLTTDSAGRVSFLNERARAIIRAEGGAALHFDELFANPFGSGSLFARLLAGDAGCSSLECTLTNRRGAAVPVRLNTTILKLDEHHGRSVVAIFEDLGEQKRMEEELRRADRLRSLGELSAGVAHEIRNPLTGIATTAQVLRERLAGDREKEEYVRVILGEISRLDDIIKNLLNFARPLSPHPSEVFLAALMEEALALLADSARERGVTLHFESRLDDDRCLLDGDQVKQIILNVALNGIQACEGGGRVSATVGEAVNPAFICIEIADTGLGIPQDIADKLYDPFFTTKAEGTGMGLSISRKIVESHGGRMFHRSVAGSGTSFFIELPRRTLLTAMSAAAPSGE